MEIRIGAGSGCSSDRLEPAVDLVKRGNLDYIVFESLAERSLAINLEMKRENSNLGYNPMLEERMEAVLPLAYEKKTKIITNMGSGNVVSALKIVKKIAVNHQLKGLKIGALLGDDVKELVSKNFETDNCIELTSANAYLGVQGIVDLLEAGCHVVITGRVADASLFAAPVLYEFKEEIESDFGAQAILMGHLLECCGQISGGFFADPTYKDVADLGNLGFPYASFYDDGNFTLSKLKNTGGNISEATVKEQLVYEVFNLEEYYTPDIVVDFSKVDIKEVGADTVEVGNAKFVGIPDTYKVTLSKQEGYVGIGEISFAGKTSLQRAKLCEEIIKRRLDIIGAEYKQIKFSYIGYSSIIPEALQNDYTPMEIRLRLFVHADTEDQCKKVIREFDFMYTNGPAGSCAIETKTRKMLTVDSCFISKKDVEITTVIEEV